MAADLPVEKINNPVRLLILEDDEVDALWVERAIQRSKMVRYVFVRTGTLAEALAMLAKETFDIILSDLKVPDAFGLEIYEALTRSAPELPIILWTGNVLDEGVAIAAVQHGAQDYLIKGQVDERGLLRSLAYANERKKLLAMRDNFINIVSHELRSPLSALYGSLEIAFENSVAAGMQSQKEMLEIALRSITRLFRITDDLLAVAKLEAGKSKQKKTVFNIKDLAREIQELFQGPVGKKGMELKTVFPAEAVEVFADRDEIARVFTNLLGNALKFTLTGFIQISVSETKTEVQCGVTDTGCGIAPEEIDKVFSKFEQFGKPPSGGEKGTGLGLSICKGIVELHGGRIWIESTLGEGTTFFFTLPKNSQPRKKLGEILTEAGAITQEQLNEALKKQSR